MVLGARVTAAMCARGREIADPQLSPDGERVAFVVTINGRSHLAVMASGGGPELIVSTDPPPKRVPLFGGGVHDWTPDGEFLVYAGSDGGVWKVPSGGGPAVSLARHLPDESVEAVAVSPDGHRVAYVVGQRAVAVLSLEGLGHWPVRLSTEVDFCLDPTWPPDSARVAWQEWSVPNMAWDESRIAARRSDGSGATDPVFDRSGVQVQQPRFSPDGRYLGFLCDAGGWLNLWAIDDAGFARCVVAETFEHGGPTWGAGQRTYAWSPDGSQIALCRNENGFGELIVADVGTGVARAVARGVHGSLSWRGTRLVALRSGARTPHQLVAYDTVTWERTVLAQGPVGGWEDADLQEPELLEWSSGDGATVYGRLYRPLVSALGEGAAPPLIGWIHGGPTGQDMVTFNPRVAYFVDRGWAVLMIDHRGSTGHGRAYTQAMRERWGEIDVADTATGLQTAAERGWCDPRAMVVMGGSAGGFTVLNLLAQHPELCAAGISRYGVTDLLDLDETTHRYEKHYLHTIVGPLPGAVERYRNRSPVNHIERITAPLLVLHGANDQVVSPAQSQALVERLRRAGRAVECHVYDGEGHGWSRPETVVDELTRIEDFLRRHVLRWRA